MHKYKRAQFTCQNAIIVLIFVASAFMALYAGSLKEVGQQESVILEMRDVMTSGQIREVSRRLEGRAGIASDFDG